jgi:hypothetical protein
VSPTTQRRTFPTLAKRSFAFWFGGIWLSCGLLFLVIGIGVGVETTRTGARLEREGQVTEGMVLTKTVSRRQDKRGRQSTSYRVGYRFTAVDGTVVNAEAEVSGRLWDRLVEREPVMVTYLPSRPQTSRLEGQPSDWMLPGIFALVGTVLTGIGGLIFVRGVRGILRELRLREEGAMVQATVVDVGPANVSFNGVPQWRVVYRYVDHRGREHEGRSTVMPPEEAQAWKPGDTATARFDTRAPRKSIWIGKA